jgi:hypothetical protein
MNQNKIILDLCGGTGSWSKPYKEAGYDVRLVTLPDFDVRTYIPPDNVYGILAAPPCDQFSYARTNAKHQRDLRGSMAVVNGCIRIIWETQYNLIKDTSKVTPLKFWALENPNSLLKFFIGRPALEFHPWQFGDDYKKKTHLWGWFNDPIETPIECTKPKFDRLMTKEIAPEYYGKLTRKERRAITPPGFAGAFFNANR